MEVLAIGNSFSQDATRYLREIAVAGGQPLNVTNLYRGGCSLAQHVGFACREEAAYEKQVNGDGESHVMATSREVLSSQPWDFVTLQQASHFSADKATYQPYLTTLAEYVKQYAPGAQLVIHETWAYEEGSQRLTEEFGFVNQRAMYDQLEAAYEQAARDLGGISIIPCGYAFQHALALGFSNLHRDTFHASIPQGRYLLAAVWYEFFTRETVVGNAFLPEGLSPQEQEFLQCCAHEALVEWEQNHPSPCRRENP